MSLSMFRVHVFLCVFLYFTVHTLKVAVLKYVHFKKLKSISCMLLCMCVGKHMYMYDVGGRREP